MDFARRHLTRLTCLSRRLAAAALGALALIAWRPAGADTQTLVLREGTGIAVSATPGGDAIFTDIAGRLWRIDRTGSAASPLTPENEIAQRPAVAPDGLSIAYQSLRGGFFQVMQIAAAGGAPRQLTSGEFHHLAPAWAPDGRKLLVAANRTGDYSLWELDLELLTLTQMTFEPGDELDPAWSPTGNAIAYAADDGRRSALYLREPLRAARELVSNGARLRAPAWRPDGSVISFVAEGREGPRLNMVILSEPPVVKELSRTEDAFPFPAAWLDRDHFLYTADGRIRQQEFGALAASELPFTATVQLATAPSLPKRSLQPAGEQQAVRGLGGFTVRPDGHLIVAALGNLWELTDSGTLVRQLTDDPFVDADPAVSGDGRRLAFVSDRDGTAQLWLMDLADGATRQISREPAAASHPAWNPAGDRLAYLAGQPDGRPVLDLKLVDPATGATVVLASRLPPAVTPGWVPDGSGVAILQGTRVAIYPADGSGGLRRLTLLNEAVGTGPAEAQWSADGQSVALASTTGITVLPVLAGGIIGADWHRVSTLPAGRVRWTRTGNALVVAGPDGLSWVSTDGGERRPIPLPMTMHGAPASGRLVVRAGRVFDGEGPGYLFAQDIVIEGNRIVELRPWSAAPAPGERLMDARGKTVIPGLIDLVLRLDAPVSERIGRALLAYGITTVQAQANDGSGLREAAERWQAYQTGPRLFAQLNHCGDSAPISADRDLMASIRVCAALALDPAPTAFVAARDAGLPIWVDTWLPLMRGAAHVVAPDPGDPWTAIGSSTVLYQDAIDVIARSGAAFTPGLAARALPGLIDRNDGAWLTHRQYPALFSAGERERLERAWRAAVADGPGARRIREQQRALGRIAAGGGRLALGSGAPVTPYGLGFHAELALLGETGLKPAQILRLATAEAARLVGLGSELGTLATGRLADLLVIDGDPLADVTQILRLDSVILDGKVREAADLLAPPEPLEKFTPSGGTAPRKTSQSGR